MRIGIFGGTFDPIHLGHLILAEQAREQLDLAQVLFIPTGDPWMKPEKPRTSPEMRLRMVELAVEANPAFKASDSEVRREGPTYTVDTLQALRATGDPADEYFFLLGMDSLAGLPRWRQASKVVELCTIAVFRRPGAPEQGVEAVVKELPLLKGKLVQLDTPVLEISSTDIRRRIASGRSIRYLVPQAVGAFIRANGLYQEP